MSENKPEVKGFFLHFDQVEALCNVPPEHITSVLLACVAYCKGEMPDMSDPFVKVMFPLMRPALDKSLARAAAGKRGGEANESKTKQNEANESEGDFASVCSPKNKNKKEEENTTLRVDVASEADDASPDTCAGVAPCPHREIIAAYHAELPTLAKVKIWEGTRQKNLQARWRSCWERGKYATTVDGIAYWRRLFRFIHDKCPFLMGEVTSRDGKTWRADLGWLVKPENFAKLIEGKYDARSEA